MKKIKLFKEFLNESKQNSFSIKELIANLKTRHFASFIGTNFPNNNDETNAYHSEFGGLPLDNQQDRRITTDHYWEDYYIARLRRLLRFIFNELSNDSKPSFDNYFYDDLKKIDLKKIMSVPNGLKFVNHLKQILSPLDKDFNKNIMNNVIDDFIPIADAINTEIWSYR